MYIKTIVAGRIKRQGEVGKKGERNDRLTCNLKGWESNA
jgi:hypothetical protein